MANRVGEQLGKYRLIRLLGRGSFAEVYLGEHVHLKTAAAVKVLHAQLAEDDAGDFLKEAQTIARLVHPHIVRIFDFDVQEGTPFLVMDYAPNGTLRQRHPKGIPLPRQMIVQYVKQVADALQHAHDQKLIHRDVKPENMLIGRRNEILLSDFGTVQVAQSTHMEGEQKIAGTVAYMSPEQLQGKARVASDQYALGIAVYEWLSGERPFHGSFSQMASQHLFTPPAPLHEKIPAIPSAVDEVVMMALAKEPRQRFESVQAFANALELASFASSSVSFVSPYAPPIPIVPVIGPTSTVVREPSQPPQPLPAGSNPSLPTVAPVSTDPPAQVQRRLSPGSDPSLPAMVPPRVMQPPQVPQPLPPAAQPVTTDPAWLQQQRRKKIGRNVLLIALAVLIIAGSLTAYFVLLKIPSPSPRSSLCNGLRVCKAPDGEYIGLSDGTFAFDTNRPDGILKLQAADKLKHHDVGGAVLRWQQAVEQDTNDAESLIYLEDQRVLDSHAPYITLVVGTVLTGNAVGDGREDLEGAYVAQNEFNDGMKLPGGVQVRLLIASSGARAEDTTTVAQQIVQAAQVDKTIVGVMGWPFSFPSRYAIAVLATAHIPMISPTAHEDFLTGISPYFFRVTPPDHRQAIVGAQYAEQTLHATRAALFVDPASTYSMSLATSFKQQFNTDGKAIVATEDYTVGHPEMLSGLLQDALFANPNVIYFAGSKTDVTTLLAALPTSGPFANIQVLGGEALYEDYHSGTRIGLTRLHFTTSASSDEWAALNLPAKKPPFFTEYQQDLYPSQQPGGGTYMYPSTSTILSYDATLALLTGSTFALTGGKKIFSSSDLRQALTRITGFRAIQGVSGQISFGPDGNAINKAVVLLTLNPQGDVRIESILGVFLVGS